MPNTDLVPADDPNRCTGITHSGQCTSGSLPGTTKCAAHGGAVASKKHQQRQYLIEEARIADRVSNLSSHESIYSLREEIALLRMCVERLISQPNVDLMLQAPALVSLFSTLEKLVKTSAQVECKLGNMLSKDTVMQIGSAMIEVINEELKDLDDYEERVDRITELIVEKISKSKDTAPEET